MKERSVDAEVTGKGLESQVKLQCEDTPDTSACRSPEGHCGQEQIQPMARVERAAGPISLISFSLKPWFLQSFILSQRSLHARVFAAQQVLLRSGTTCDAGRAP